MSVMIIQGLTWYKGQPPALLLGVGIWVEDGSQPTLERVHDYLMFSGTHYYRIIVIQSMEHWSTMERMHKALSSYHLDSVEFLTLA